MHSNTAFVHSQAPAACPTCKRKLGPRELVRVDHEAVCSFCGTVIQDDSCYAAPEPDTSEPAGRAELSFSMIGDYQKLLPEELKPRLTHLKKLYLNRPTLSIFSAICDWLALPPYVSREAWSLFNKIEGLNKCARADSALFAIMRTCQRRSIPRTEAQIAYYVLKELGRKRVRSYTKICSSLLPLSEQVDPGMDTLNYYVNLGFQRLAQRHGSLDINKVRAMVWKELHAQKFGGNNEARVRKTINFVVGGLHS